VIGDETLRRSLELLRSSAEWPDGYVYRGAADFVLRHGSFYEARLCGKPANNRACFGNSLVIAELLGWRYVEGFALNLFGLPIHHAWIVDVGGQALELTWAALGSGYMGVEFDPLRADDATWNGDASVLDDWKRGYPLFKQPWTGEPELSTFTPTEVMRQAIALHELKGDEHLLARFGEGRQVRTVLTEDR
jgi:hypothetical protein